MGFSRYGRGGSTSYVRRCKGGNFERACIQNYIEDATKQIIREEALFPQTSLTIHEASPFGGDYSGSSTDWQNILIDPIRFDLGTGKKWMIHVSLPTNIFWAGAASGVVATIRLQITHPSGSTSVFDQFVNMPESSIEHPLTPVTSLRGSDGTYQIDAFVSLDKSSGSDYTASIAGRISAFASRMDIL